MPSTDKKQIEQRIKELPKLIKEAEKSLKKAQSELRVAQKKKDELENELFRMKAEAEKFKG